MKQIILFYLFIVSSFTNVFWAQGGSSCNTSTPFCTGTTYSFPSVTGRPNLGSVGCLGSAPNPTWYHFQIANPGSLTIKIQQGSNDVDFACWGPFSNPTGACGGNGNFPSGSIVSCSYSSASVEYCTINGASTGQWYILLITNYSGAPGNVVFTQSGGNATTNCCILSSTEAGNSFTKTCVANTSGATIGTSPVSGSTYSWSPTTGLSNPSISNPVANPSSTTTYTLIETDASGCVFTDAVTVNVNTTLPNTNAGPDVTTNCYNPTRVLNGSGGVAYSWSPTAGLSNATIANPTANPSSTTTYTLQATGSNGCTKTDDVVVTVDKTPPTANAGSGATTTCITPTATLNGSGGGSYAWSPTAGLSNASIANPIANPNTTTTYTLTVTASNGCTDTDNVQIVVDETPPSVNAGPDFTINCTTPTYDLQGSGSGTYLWSPATGLSNATIATPTATPSNTTTYTLTVTGANGCTNTDNTTITVDKGLPNANAGADVELDCITTSGSFTATGGVSYSWIYPDGTSNGATVNFTDANTPGNYIVTVTGANGCSLTDTAELIINQTPPNASAGADVIFDCATSSGTFTATGGGTYSWLLPNGNTSTNATINVSMGDDVGNYVVTIASPNGCTSIDTAQLIVDTVLPIANAGVDSLLTCYYNSINLDASASSSGVDFVYNWVTSDGNIVSGSNTISPIVDYVGTYVLTVTDTSNSCYKLDSVYVGVDTVYPVAIAGIDTIISCNIPVIQLNGQGSSVGNYAYNWTTNNGNITQGGNSLTPTVNQGGDYELEVTNLFNGCSSIDQVFVDEDLTATVDILYQSSSVDTILGTAAFDVEYSWDGDNGTVNWDFGDNNFSTDSSLVHTYNLRGEYLAIIELTDDRGCIAYDSVVVIIDGREIRFPNVFTPNGDGINDVFTFRAEKVKSFECYIFNRWGQLLYSWNTPSGGWDGRTFAGEEVREGNYYYVLKAVNHDRQTIEKKGEVMLMR